MKVPFLLFFSTSGLLQSGQLSPVVLVGLMYLHLGYPEHPIKEPFLLFFSTSGLLQSGQFSPVVLVGFIYLHSG